MKSNENMPVAFELERTMEDVNVTVTRVAEGLGFGDGAISGAELRTRVGAETVRDTEAFIESSDVIVPIDKDSEGALIDDCGCADGRHVVRIFQGLDEKTASKARQKVFGGSAAMATAIEIGAGTAAGAELQTVFTKSIATLKQLGIKFGAHTADTVASDTDSGCGALDKAVESILAVSTHADKVYESLAVFGYSREQAQPIMENYKAYGRELIGQTYSGRKVVDEIIDEGMIVKQLGGKHMEFGLVICDVEGYTINQQGVRDASHNTLQVFAADMPRMRRIAREYTKLRDDPNAFDQAMISQLVFTLGVSGVLTQGDQTIWNVQSQSQMATA
jgi:hypothetical protein